jgi:hypothetical protein
MVRGDVKISMWLKQFEDFAPNAPNEVQNETGGWGNEMPQKGDNIHICQSVHEFLADLEGETRDFLLQIEQDMPDTLLRASDIVCSSPAIY